MVPPLPPGAGPPAAALLRSRRAALTHRSHPRDPAGTPHADRCRITGWWSITEVARCRSRPSRSQRPPPTASRWRVHTSLGTFPSRASGSSSRTLSPTTSGTRPPESCSPRCPLRPPSWPSTCAVTAAPGAQHRRRPGAARSRRLRGHHAHPRPRTGDHDRVLRRAARQERRPRRSRRSEAEAIRQSPGDGQERARSTVEGLTPAECRVAGSEVG